MRRPSRFSRLLSTTAGMAPPASGSSVKRSDAVLTVSTIVTTRTRKNTVALCPMDWELCARSMGTQSLTCKAATVGCSTANPPCKPNRDPFVPFGRRTSNAKCRQKYPVWTITCACTIRKQYCTRPHGKESKKKRSGIRQTRSIRPEEYNQRK